LDSTLLGLYGLSHEKKLDPGETGKRLILISFSGKSGAAGELPRRGGKRWKNSKSQGSGGVLNTRKNPSTHDNPDPRKIIHQKKKEEKERISGVNQRQTRAHQEGTKKSHENDKTLSNTKRRQRAHGLFRNLYHERIARHERRGGK